MRLTQALLAALSLLLLAVPPARAAAGDRCLAAAAAVERERGLPRGLLQAIALAESGRWDPAEGRSYAWPWTVVSGSRSVYHDSREAALRHVRRLQAEGRRNIDVGCMQINLGYHPDAFARLDDAFDPREGASYAAGFLETLKAETGDWAEAVAYYHSRRSERGGAYRRRVYRHWARLGALRVQPESGIAPAAPDAGGAARGVQETLDPAVLQAANRAAVAANWRWLHAGPAPPAAMAGTGAPVAGTAADDGAPPRIFAGAGAAPGAVRGIVLVGAAPGGRLVP